MGTMTEYNIDGTELEAYIAHPEGGGPGIVVIQEWWGLVDHIKHLCDRVADAGFVAIAPDLYHGEHATAPDEAKRLMMSLEVDKAARERGRAIDVLLADDAVQGPRVGVAGFCLGGGLTYVLAITRPDDVAAIAPFYGIIPWPDAQPDYSRVKCKVQGHYAEHDHTITVEGIHALEAELRATNDDVEWILYADAHHGFFNDTRSDVHDAEQAALAFERVTAYMSDALT